ncbi:WecB/TagA/CpsF family glycosyltransferase [Burkholderiaceae bacterium DAT-1]|nr:WecB/TagA/CpsF family glycosyltransferase [Burkholderiaceae bacterium DAT-1]
MSNRHTTNIIGSPIDNLTWEIAVSRIFTWAKARESKVVCICNTHSVVTAKSDKEFQYVLHNADMATADGFPVAWLIRKIENNKQDRINGPDLMWECCKKASTEGISMYLYGGSQKTLSLLAEKLRTEFPDMVLAGFYSPPYRDLSDEEDQQIIDQINESGARIVWVGLGCPKQEKWMEQHRNNINAVMVGVGAAFDYHAGTIQRAPLWMQRNGLEWFHRLCSEPRRLWKRYLVTNTLFAFHAVKQLFFSRKNK